MDRARQQNITQVNTLDYDGIFIRLYPINNSQPDPIIKIDTSSPSGLVFLTFKLTQDIFGWHATFIGGVAE